MKWFLGIDTSGIELSIGLVCDSMPVASYNRYIKNGHAECIAESIDFLCKRESVSPRQLSGVGIVTGPGSFTGLRVGIAFLKGFAFDSTLHALPISSLYNTAYAVGKHSVTSCTVLFDARQQRVFRADFEWKGDVLYRKTDDCLLPSTELHGACSLSETIIYDCLGNTRSPIPEAIQKNGHAIDIAKTPVQRGLACAIRTSKEQDNSSLWTRSESILPRYLSASYAESKLT